MAARPFGNPSSANTMQSGSKGGSRAASAMHGMRLYNMDGQWTAEEEEDVDAELATQDQPTERDCGLVTG